MIVGVKYCGGCNPTYDRGLKIKETLAEHPDWKWEYAQEGKEYDILLVAYGCMRACAAINQYNYKEIVSFEGNI